MCKKESDREVRRAAEAGIYHKGKQAPRVLTWGMSGLRRPVVWVRRKPPRPRPERPRSSRIKVAQTKGG